MHYRFRRPLGAVWVARREHAGAALCIQAMARGQKARRHVKDFVWADYVALWDEPKPSFGTATARSTKLKVGISVPARHRILGRRGATIDAIRCHLPEGSITVSRRTRSSSRQPSVTLNGNFEFILKGMQQINLCLMKAHLDPIKVEDYFSPKTWQDWLLWHSLIAEQTLTLELCRGE